MTFTYITLHPTFLSYMREVLPDCDLSEEAQQRARPALITDGFAAFVLGGKIHMWVEDDVDLGRLARSLGERLSRIVDPSGEGRVEQYGQVAEETLNFILRLVKAGRI